METRESLLARLGEINEELRNYPQPIARCDAQLGGLQEERMAIRARLAELEAAGAGKECRYSK